MKNTVHDSYFALYAKEDHAKLIEDLQEFQADTHWEAIEAKNTRFVPLSSVEETELAVGAGEAYKDSMGSELPIAAVLPDGRKYLMRPYLLKNIKQHHRDNALVLSDMLHQGKIDAFCEHVSMGRHFLKKSILMMVRGEKISGWFSDFNASWSQLAQIEFFEEKMRSAFPNMKFESAEVSHYCTTVNYTLDDSMDSRALHDSLGLKPGVMDAYIDAWVSAGLPAEVLRSAVPICQFVTGESGLTSIEVRPYIRLNNKWGCIPLGNKLSVNHRGSDEHVWEKFETFPGQVAILYQKGLAGIERLCYQTMRHPYCAITHVLAQFRASVPMKRLQTCAANAEIFWPREDEEAVCKAIDIFNCVNESVSAANAELSPIRRLRNAETIGRLCHMDWREFDVATVNKSFAKSDADKMISDDDFGI